jgi:hypothetical protein
MLSADMIRRDRGRHLNGSVNDGSDSVEDAVARSKHGRQRVPPRADDAWSLPFKPSVLVADMPVPQQVATRCPDAGVTGACNV